MGKNTMMRKAIKQQMETNPALEKILPYKVQAPARAGAIAPLDVVIPAQYVSIFEQPENDQI